MKSEYGRVMRGDGSILVGRARRPLGPIARARGLIGAPPLGAEDGLWIDRCDSIHMFGMRYAIDVVFLRMQRIERLCADVHPMRARWCRRADAVLELASGAIARLGLSESDTLQFLKSDYI
jgi:uncharacterized membrane protein (UPF0127 family)